MKHRLLVICLLLSLMLVATGSVLAATLVVHPGNLQGWAFEVYPVSANLEPEFVNGPDTPPSGTGSYYVEIDEANEKIILKRGGYHNIALSALNALSFWTYLDPTSTETHDWYVNLYLDLDGLDDNDGDNNDYDVRLSLGELTGTPGTWVQHNSIASANWQAFYRSGETGTFTKGTLTQFLTEFPNARFNAWDNPADYQITISMGDSLSNFVGYKGAIDAIRIDIDGMGDNTWNFELQGPSSPPPSKDDDDDPTPAPAPTQQTVNGIPTSFSGDDAAEATNGQIMISGSGGNISQDGATGSSYAKLLALNGEFYGDPSSIGNMDLLNMGVLAAVDIFGLLPGGVSVTDFTTPVNVCFAGTGAVYFLSANDPTRTPILLAGTGSNGQTCVSVSSAGMLVMVGTPNPAGIQPAATETPLTDCAVTTTVQLRFRSGPSTSDPILTVLPFGTTVDAGSRTGDWYGVTYNGQQGYVSAEFVETAGNC